MQSTHAKDVQVTYKEQPVVNEQPQVTEIPAPQAVDVSGLEGMTLNITVAELAMMISNVANGKTAYIRGLPTHDSAVERIMDTTLGSFNDGCHRILDGATDIVGGVLDILFLGRTNNK